MTGQKENRHFENQGLELIRHREMDSQLAIILQTMLLSHPEGRQIGMLVMYILTEMLLGHLLLTMEGMNRRP
jgi:hypothetical protein